MRCGEKLKEKHVHIHSWIYCALVKLEENKADQCFGYVRGWWEGGRGRETGEATLHVIYVHIAQKSQRIL
jgi:hypothetical protein